MFDYNHQNNLAMGAEVVAGAKVGGLGMARSTVYKWENFFPLPMPVVKAIIGEQLFAKVYNDIRSIAVYREDEYKVPIAKLIMLLGNAASQSIVDALYAYNGPAWVEQNHNVVVMAGLTDSIDKHFKGSAYTAAWYVGLVSGTPSFAEGNTMASHSGWFEVAPYSGARPTLTLGTVVSGSVDNSSNKAAYTINATMVVGGGFVVNLPTASQTSGTLYGGAAFSGGNRSVQSGDTLNVTVTLSATAS